MSKKRFFSWVAVSAFIVVGWVSIGQSRWIEGRPINPGQSFTKIGRYYLNVHRIDYVIVEGGDLVVVFGSEAASHLKLSGLEAADMKRWLDEQEADGERLHRSIYPHPGHSSAQPDYPQSDGSLGPDSGRLQQTGQQVTSPFNTGQRVGPAPSPGLPTQRP
jgi:hypothetical protein